MCRGRQRCHGSSIDPGYELVDIGNIFCRFLRTESIFWKFENFTFSRDKVYKKVHEKFKFANLTKN